jgi:hypothetical protein
MSNNSRWRAAPVESICKLADCKRVLATARNPGAGKPLHKNIRLVRLDNGDYAIRYYDTDVVTYHLDNTVTLDNGGWQTKSTKETISSFSPFNIYQEKGRWIVTVGDFRFPFTRCMRIDLETYAVVETAGV